MKIKLIINGVAGLLAGIGLIMLLAVLVKYYPKEVTDATKKVFQDQFKDDAMAVIAMPLVLIAYIVSLVTGIMTLMTVKDAPSNIKTLSKISGIVAILGGLIVVNPIISVLGVLKMNNSSGYDER